MTDPEQKYYDESELSETPEATDNQESPYQMNTMPQINEAMEDTHASYARLWEQYSAEQGVPSGEEEPEGASASEKNGMEFAANEEKEGGGMSRAA